MNTLKKTLLGLVASFAQDTITENIAVSGIMTALSSFSPYMVIPFLVLAYGICNYKKEKMTDDEQKEELDHLLQCIRDECKTKLEELRKTQITELEKIINCYLYSKATHEELKELKEFVEGIITQDHKTLCTILDEIDFSKEEIDEILEYSQIIMLGIFQIKKSINQMNLQIRDIQHSSEEIKDQNRKIEDIARNSLTHEPHVKLSVFNSCTTFPPVRTNYSTSHNDNSLDNAINIILHMIEQGNYKDALQKTEIIFSDTRYQGDHELIAWEHALVACIYYLQYDPKGNDEAQKLEEAFYKASSGYLPPFLANIYAKYHIFINEPDAAYSILTDSINKEYTSEAKALLLSLSKNTVEEDVKSLTQREHDSVIINSVLAQRSIVEKNYDNAIIYAKKAYYLAKEDNTVPPANIYAYALFKKRFPSGFITSGFMRRHIEDKEWPEAFEIIELYKESIDQLTEMVSSRGKSFFLYSIALVYFICGKESEAARYAQMFFDLNEVEEDAIEFCATVLAIKKDIKSCICNLKKYEKSLSAGAQYLYGLLLMESKSESEQSEGVHILEQIIEDSQHSDTFSYFGAAMRLGNYLLDNNENEKLSSLINKTHAKGDILSYCALSSLECENSSPEKSKNFLLELIPLIPAELPARAKIVEILSPHFQRHNLFSELMQLMDSYVPMDEITEIGKEYFSISLKAKDSKRVKTMGKSLRRAGIWDQEFLNSEINYTLQYSKIETEELTNECIDNIPDIPMKRIITVYRDMAALSTGNFEKYVHDATSYPALAEIPSNSSYYPYANIPYLLNKAGKKDEAIKYAYGLYILYPNEPPVRKTLFAMVMGQDKEECLSKPENINENAAFRYRSLKGNSSFLVIIEQQDSANPVFKKPNSPLVKLLWNSTVGYRFKTSPYAQEDEYEITDISNKYVAATLQVMEEDTLIPGSGITLITTPSDAFGHNDVSAIFETAQQINKIQLQRIDAATALYQQTIRSFYLFKIFAGFDTLRAIRYSSKRQDISIESAIGDIQERNTAISLLKGTKKILLSPLSLDLLIILEADSDVDILRIIVESGIEICISEYLFEDRFSSDYGSVSFAKLFNDGQHVGIMDDSYEEKCYRISLKMKDYIHEKANIIKGELMNSDFSQEEDNKEKRVWGRALYHTMFIANTNNDVLLWDDDSTLIALFNQSYKWNIDRRVFSQAVFLFLKEQEKLTPAEYFKTTIFLLSINERFTSFDSQVLYEVFFKPEIYGNLRDRIEWHFGNTTLERISFANILYDSMITFFTEHTNLQRAKEGFSLLYKCVAKQDSNLVEQVLYKAAFVSLEKNKKKAKPVIKYAISSLQDILSLKLRNSISSLLR